MQSINFGRKSPGSVPEKEMLHVFLYGIIISKLGGSDSRRILVFVFFTILGRPGNFQTDTAAIF